MDENSVKGGTIKLNYVEADAFTPLTVENDIVTEAAFSGDNLNKGKKQTTLVLFTFGENGLYVAETHVFDDKGNELKELVPAKEIVEEALQLVYQKINGIQKCIV